MDDFLSIVFVVFIYCLLGLYVFDSVHSDDVKRIDKYVFEHDYSLSRSENWDAYLDGQKVDVLGLDLYSLGYNVVFDGYNKIVIVTSKKRYSIF